VRVLEEDGGLENVRCKSSDKIVYRVTVIKINPAFFFFLRE
jgi:hypothetical protein